MKKWILFLALNLIGGMVVQASSVPVVVKETRTPTLRSEKIWFDASTGKLRGTVYLNRGYATPRLPHVHVYAYGNKGKLLFSGCAELNDYSLHLQRFNLSPRDTFAISLPSNYPEFKKIKVVTDSEDRCEGHADASS